MAIYCLLLYFVLSEAKGKFPLPLLLSPAVLGSAAYSNFVVRKDALGVPLLLLCLYLKKEPTFTIVQR
jgi:hypothetical protein